MKTLIFDIDGTLTDMRPLEDPRLRLANPNPTLLAYPAAQFITDNAKTYHYVFATGGTLADTTYVLRQLGLVQIFDMTNSIAADSGLPPKSTGEPYKQIAAQFPDSIVIGDSETDRAGAKLAGLPCVILAPNETLTDQKLRAAVLG